MRSDKVNKSFSRNTNRKPEQIVEDAHNAALAQEKGFAVGQIVVWESGKGFMRGRIEHIDPNTGMLKIAFRGGIERHCAPTYVEQEKQEK